MPSFSFLYFFFNPGRTGPGPTRGDGFQNYDKDKSYYYHSFKTRLGRRKGEDLGRWPKGSPWLTYVFLNNQNNLVPTLNFFKKSTSF
jgi:hypothetical protein